MNKESLFARTTCFRRFPRLRLAITFSTLIVALYLGIISESWAACGATVTTAGTDENGDYCGICNDAGTCKWKLNSSGELNIYAADGAKEVAMKNYGKTKAGKDSSYPAIYKTTAPWGGLGATSLVIGDNIANIGEAAFVGESRITDISGMKDVKQIGAIAFHVMTGVSSLELPEGLTSVGGSAFQYMLGLQELIISDNLNTEGWGTSAFAFLSDNLDTRCKGDMDICKAKMAKYVPVADGGLCDSKYCLPNATLQAASETQCTGSNYYWNGKSCSNKKNGIVCADGFKRIEDFCNRVRYSPAEAAEIANEDNTNVVTITFRK